MASEKSIELASYTETSSLATLFLSWMSQITGFPKSSTLVWLLNSKFAKALMTTVAPLYIRHQNRCQVDSFTAKELIFGL